MKACLTAIIQYSNNCGRFGSRESDDNNNNTAVMAATHLVIRSIYRNRL